MMITLLRLKKLPLAFACPILLATSAPAAVIYYSGLVDIPVPTTFNGVYLDIGTQVNSTPSNELPSVQTDSYTVGYNQPSSWDINFFFGGIGIAYSDTFSPFVDDTVSNRSQILNVAQGTVIIDEALSRTLATAAFGGSGRSNQSTGDSHFDIPELDGATYSAFTPGVEGYIAFVLNPGVNVFYGWLRVTLTNDGTVGTIHDWAYSSDSGFTVGQIPEPRAALIGGIGMLMLLRRRR
jgi:hypothetical protein